MMGSVPLAIPHQALDGDAGLRHRQFRDPAIRQADLVQVWVPMRTQSFHNFQFEILNFELRQWPHGRPMTRYHTRLMGLKHPVCGGGVGNAEMMNAE